MTILGRLVSQTVPSMAILLGRINQSVCTPAFTEWLCQDRIALNHAWGLLGVLLVGSWQGKH